jgi:hypothetical protein
MDFNDLFSWLPFISHSIDTIETEEDTGENFFIFSMGNRIYGYAK